MLTKIFFTFDKEEEIDFQRDLFIVISQTITKQSVQTNIWLKKDQILFQEIISFYRIEKKHWRSIWFDFINENVELYFDI